MSAPPIGMMMSTPNRKAANASSRNATWLSVRANQTISTTIAMASAMLTAWRAGKMIGAPLMRADSSSRKAITEPVKVTAPMATPSDISTRLAPGMCLGVPMPKAAGA